ncbi:MAG: GNAT family protein [Halanaerobium sp.]|nr:GNAT family protein [Halanaerobium sp.]
MSEDQGLYLDEFTEELAREICSWRYAHPYDVYDWPSWEDLVAEEEDIVKDEVRKDEFRALFDREDNYCGFVHFDNIGESHIRIKLGLMPEMTGRGIGGHFLALITEEVKRRLPDGLVDLEVLTWNKRAIKVYERSGFKIVETYERKTPTGKAEFHRMELQL